MDPGTSFSQLFEKLQAGSIELFQPYAAKLQHCEISQGNVSKSKDTCEQCDMWRLLYSKRKLTLSEKQQLQSLFEDVSYSCGAMLEELNLPDTLSSVCILDHNCNDPIEPLYYSADFSAICVYCPSEDLSNSPTSDYYPMCVDCFGSRDPIKKGSSVLCCVKCCFVLHPVSFDLN